MRVRTLVEAHSISSAGLALTISLLALGIVACNGDRQAKREGGSEKRVEKVEDCSDPCSRLPHIGKTVAEMRVALAPPTPQGGVLTPGTYVLTEMTQFTGPGGATGATGLEKSMTQRIGTSGSQITVDTAYVHAIDQCPEYQQSATATISGTDMKVVVSCWTGHQTPFEVVQPYTATEDTIIVFRDPARTMTFVRQK